MITDFTSVKKMKLNFEKPTFATQFTKVSSLLNETALFQIVNVKGMVFAVDDTHLSRKITKLSK